MDPVKIGVIGGSGLYDIDGLEDVTEVKPSTADLAGVLGRSPTTFNQWVNGVAGAFAL